MTYDPLVQRGDVARDMLQAVSHELRKTVDEAHRRKALRRQQHMMNLLAPSDRQWLAVRMKLEAEP